MATKISKDFQDSFDGNYGYPLDDLSSYQLVDMIKNFMVNKESNGTMGDDSYYDIVTIGFELARLALTKAKGGHLMDKEFMEHAKLHIIC